MNRIIKRLAVPLSAAAVLGTAGFAYMASNTVPNTNAGAGSADISGYTVSNVHYGLMDHGVAHAAADAQVKTVSFDLTADNPGGGLAPTTLWVTLKTDLTPNAIWARYDNCVVNGNPGSTTNYTCTFTPFTGNNAAMATNMPELQHVKSLQVSAAQ